MVHVIARSSLICLVLFMAFSCNAQENRIDNNDLSLHERIDSLQSDTNQISILIDKSDFRLYVLVNESIIQEYPVVFGKNPVDDKFMQGDKCTPEGKFRMIAKYPHEKWSKFIWLNYPTDDSWNKFNAAKNEGKIPYDAHIGGEIGIHGVPNGMDFLIDIRYNWTLGCISLKNTDLDELYSVVTKNTLIEIRK